MSEITPYILIGIGVIISAFGFFIEQTISDLKKEIADLKISNGDLWKKVHDIDKADAGSSSDLKHAIDTMNEIKQMVKEKL